MECNEFINENPKVLFELNNLCRCCLIENDDMKSIFDNDLHNLIMSCANVNIAIDDGLSTLICNQCFDQVTQSCTFRQQCERSDSTLRHWFAINCKENDVNLNEANISEVEASIENDLSNYELVEVKVQYSNGDKSTVMVQVNKNSVEELRSIETLNMDNTNLETTEDDLSKLVQIQFNDTIEGLNIQSNDASQEEFLNDGFLNNDKIIEIFRNSVEPEYKQIEIEANEHEFINDDVMLSKDTNLNPNIFEPPDEILDDRFICNLCSRNFINKTKLSYHQIKNHKFHPCKFCDKIFPNSAYLRKHLKRHKGEKPYECSFCEMKFYESAILKIHTRIHTGVKPYVCDFENCGKAFTQSCQLVQHRKIHEEEKQNVCDICRKAFTLAYQLKIHKRTHTNEKPYKCEYCGKRFSQSGNLATHVRIHTGVKPFICGFSDCGKSFASVSELKNHNRKHTGEKLAKKVECPECGKKYTSNGELKNHIRTHTGEKPYSCSICLKSFLMSSHLVVHMRSHTGEKPFSCDYCDKSFATLSVLRKHTYIHTGEKKFECDLCGKKFTQPSGRNMHRKTHFKNSNSTGSGDE